MQLGKTVEWLERNMSSAERAEWYAFFKVRDEGDTETSLREGLKRDALAGLETLRKRKR